MEYRRRRYFHFQHIPQATHSKYQCPLLAPKPFITDENRETTYAHLLHFPPRPTLISYFPCAELPTDPATGMRFADLFLMRERWKAEHIKPYLSDIAVDTKDLDKLLLKYARALTDKDGSWYTARAR